jgi:hypothetical protein
MRAMIGDTLFVLSWLSVLLWLVSEGARAFAIRFVGMVFPCPF